MEKNNDDLRPEIQVDPSMGNEEPLEEGCPTCGNEDLQVAELLAAWKEIRDLKSQLQKIKDIAPKVGFTAAPVGDLVSDADRAKESKEGVNWKERYEKIKDGYIKTRLEVSGSFGNWDFATRKRVLENEISKELGFEV